MQAVDLKTGHNFGERQLENRPQLRTFANKVKTNKHDKISSPGKKYDCFAASPRDSKRTQLVEANLSKRDVAGHLLGNKS